MSTPAATAAICPVCHDPIKQPMHRGRPRKYCAKARCRKAASRKQKRAVIRQREQEQKEALEKTWLQFDSETRGYLHTTADHEGIAAASAATEAFIRLLAPESPSPSRGTVKRALASASTADLMRETAARLKALSKKTPQERGVFIEQHPSILGDLYAELSPYVISDPKLRAVSDRLTQKHNKCER